VTDSSRPVVRDFHLGWRRPAFFASIAVAFALLWGLQCAGFEGVNVERREEVWTYRCSPLWYLIVSVPGLMLVVWAFAAWTIPTRTTRLLASFFLLLALSFVGIAVLSVASVRMVLTPQGLSHTAGFPWAPDTRRVEFASLSEMTVAQDADQQGHAFVLECRLKDGRVTSIPESTILAAAARDVLKRAALAGVPIDAHEVAR
jgi:hypothetical protein